MVTKGPLNIRLVGDYQPDRPSHRATIEALWHAAEDLTARIHAQWVPTSSLQSARWERLLDGADGLWLTPGAPYQSQEGAHRSIGFARERNIPFFGTCGGFQETLLEFARNVLGIKDAQSAEYNPSATVPLLVLALCPVPARPEGAPYLWGKMTVEIALGSLAYSIYGRLQVKEEFNCNYELNPEYQHLFEKGRLRITGRGQNGEVRIVELVDHPFFLATAFQPQLSSQSGKPHPLITAFLRSAGKR